MGHHFPAEEIQSSLLWFHSSSFLDCTECYPFSPRLPKKSISFHTQGQIMSAPLRSLQPVLAALGACWTCLSPSSAPCSKEQFSQEMLSPYRALFISFLQRLPLDPGRAFTSRQISCLLSHHCPLKGPQNNLRANEADAIHQNVIKILLYKQH